MQFSSVAWKGINPIYEAIIAHPFNQKLADGSLSKSIFGYYIEQDAIYLKDFSRALSLLAARSADPEMIDIFLQFSKGALIAEQEAVHGFFRKNLNLQASGKLSPATFSYTRKYLYSIIFSIFAEVNTHKIGPYHAYRYAIHHSTHYGHLKWG